MLKRLKGIGKSALPRAGTGGSLPTRPTDPSPVPLAWAAGGNGPNPYVNLGDALSPIMVALVSRRPIDHAAMAADTAGPEALSRLRGRAASAALGGADRMAAVGTIGQNLRGGRVSIWGTGCSPYAGRPGSGPRLPFSPRADTAFDIAAARGPYTARLLTGGALPEVAMGDPALLLPRFHDRPVAPRYELGVVLHLAELADRTYEAHPAAGLVRYHGLPAAIDVPWDGQDAVGGARRVFASGAAGAGDRVALITMVTAPDAMSIADRVDTLRACRRIVSTSLHGIALALAYGIPCLYLASTAGPVGPGEAALDPSGVDLPEGLNPRFPDLYAGLGFSRMPFWRQPKAMPTDWNAVICAIDAMADPAVGLARCSGEMGDALAATCPAGVAGLHAVSVGRAGPSARSLDANSDVRSIPFMGRARASRSTAAAAMATP